MANGNPASYIVTLLKAARENHRTSSGTNKQPFRDAMDLPYQGGFSVIDALGAVLVTLEWLREEAEKMPSKKSSKYLNALEQVRRKLNWEFGDRSPGFEEPRHFNFDGYIEIFEFFEGDLEDVLNFENLDEEHLQNLDDRLTELHTLISQGNLDRSLQKLLLDAVFEIRQSIRDLRKFGSAASAERLRDALGRLQLADVMARQSGDEAKSYAAQAWVYFVQIIPFVETVSKLKCIPEFVDSWKALGK